MAYRKVPMSQLIFGLVLSLLLGFAVVVQVKGAPKKDTPQTTGEKTVKFGALNLGLGSLPLLSNTQTRSISAENPTGGKGMGARTIPHPGDPNQPYSFLTAHLGRGWKTQPFLRVKAHQTVTLMDVDGPGVIEHIWLVPSDSGFLYHGRACVLRMYGDDEKTPSVEVPVTDFFAVGHSSSRQ